MSDWQFAEEDRSEELARLHYFSLKKHQPTGDVEFVITVKEYAQRTQQNMRFFAQANRQVNQKLAPFVPFGWGDTLVEALAECMKAIRSFPYDETQT